MYFGFFLADSRLPISPENTDSNTEKHVNLQTSVSCLRRESMADAVIRERQYKRGLLRGFEVEWLIILCRVEDTLSYWHEKRPECSSCFQILTPRSCCCTVWKRPITTCHWFWLTLESLQYPTTQNWKFRCAPVRRTEWTAAMLDQSKQTSCYCSAWFCSPSSVSILSFHLLQHSHACLTPLIRMLEIPGDLLKCRVLKFDRCCIFHGF